MGAGRLAGARVLVVGAGALGNELVKNLVLLGVGRIDVVDMDVDRGSNLSRCSLFRTCDMGARRSRWSPRPRSAMNPDSRGHRASVDIRRVAARRLAGVDVVIGGLDNREARLFVNQAAGSRDPWVDGAIEGLRGSPRSSCPTGLLRVHAR